MVGSSTAYSYVNCALLPTLPTRTSIFAASVSVPLADSVSAVELLLYSHVTPAALKSELRVTRKLAFSILVPSADSAVHKKKNGKWQ